MLNICILKNLPIILLDDCLRVYHSIDKNTIVDEINPYLKTINLSQDFLQHVNTFLPLPLNSLELYLMVPGVRPVPHIDRGRKVALQIPMELDINASYTFASKYEDLEMLTPLNWEYHYHRPDDKVVNKPKTSFFEWDSNLYDMYNLELPILQNVSMPHGGVNNSKTNRFFISGSYKTYEYNYVKDAFIEFATLADVVIAPV